MSNSGAYMAKLDRGMLKLGVECRDCVHPKEKAANGKDSRPPTAKESAAGIR